MASTSSCRGSPFLLITGSARFSAASIRRDIVYSNFASRKLYWKLAKASAGGRLRLLTHTSLTPHPVPFTSPHLPEAIGLFRLALSCLSGPCHHAPTAALYVLPYFMLFVFSLDIALQRTAGAHFLLRYPLSHHADLYANHRIACTLAIDTSTSST